jgi:hypothetical protein
VWIELELPDGESFETLGRVAWSRSVVGPGGAVEAGCGVEFLDLSAEDRAPLERWLGHASA